ACRKSSSRPWATSSSSAQKGQNAGTDERGDNAVTAYTRRAGVGMEPRPFAFNGRAWEELFADRALHLHDVAASRSGAPDGASRRFGRGALGDDRLHLLLDRRTPLLLALVPLFVARRIPGAGGLRRRREHRL